MNKNNRELKAVITPFNTSLKLTLATFTAGLAFSPFSLAETETSEIKWENVKTVKTQKKTHISDLPSKEQQIPAKGMTESQVAEQFGEPVSKKPARGAPPISSWSYSKFTVYFESGYVIHTVTFK